ncbi:DoxX family protein [Arcticibacter tournemirensis]|uniref:DoxX family protein n=1 Tax=Arcticibacter tournemirensis TaxID=699437 RepID=UPI00192A39FF|nr:DoxX family protein [Arcticibacter tournemirensis]
MNKRDKFIYWITTIPLALGMFSGGVAQILRVKESADGILHLGYPVYFMIILGIWKVMGVVAILMPKFALLKEWAYAGFFFAMTGAVISHIIIKDHFAEVVAPLVFVMLTVVSWHFRPEDKKILQSNLK